MQQILSMSENICFFKFSSFPATVSWWDLQGASRRLCLSLRLEACQSELIIARASCLVSLVNTKLLSSLWALDHLTICYFESLEHFVFNLEKLSTLSSPNISHSLFLVFSLSLKHRESHWREEPSIDRVWSTIMPPSTLGWLFHLADLKSLPHFSFVSSHPCHFPCLCQCLIAVLQCVPFCSNHLAKSSALIIMVSLSGVPLAHFRCAFLWILPAPVHFLSLFKDLKYMNPKVSLISSFNFISCTSGVCITFFWVISFWFTSYLCLGFFPPLMWAVIFHPHYLPQSLAFLTQAGGQSKRAHILSLLGCHMVLLDQHQFPFL